MNNLHRELAPISAEAWGEIEEEASRTLKRYLAGRRVVDVNGPAGPQLSAVGTGHQKIHRRPGRRHSGAPARGEAPGRAARPVRAGPRGDRRCGARLGGFRLAAGEGRRPPRSPSLRMARFSRAMTPPTSRASARAPAIKTMTLPADVRAYPDAIAQALNQLRLAGVNGPYCVVLGAEPYTRLCRRAATRAIRFWRISSG